MKTAIRGKTLLCCVLLCCGLLAGCMGTGSAKIPITLTVWHVYGGQTDSPLNNLIEEFNQTVGKEQGINLVVTSVSNTNTIHESVLAAVNEEPGAPELPDLFISYPKTVAALEDASLLVDYYDYFSEEELSAYIPAFLQEGVVDGRLVVFPVAKSTEILFVNKTLFDRFAAATGASLEQLRTWEGLLETAVQYADWTDAQTPDKSGDGKIFFAHDYPFNYFQVGVISLAADFFNDGIADNSVFEQVWQPAARAAVHGGLWLEEGYGRSDCKRCFFRQCAVLQGHCYLPGQYFGKGGDYLFSLPRVCERRESGDAARCWLLHREVYPGEGESRLCFP